VQHSCFSIAGIKFVYLNGNQSGKPIAMPLYAENDLEQMMDGLSAIPEKMVRLIVAYSIKLTTANAKSHAMHGVLRRLRVLDHCIGNVYRIIPPDRDLLPTRDELNEVEINLQSAVMNTFGLTDNLAWIWHSEFPVVDAQGKEISHYSIGLGPKKKAIRASLSQPMQDLLKARDDWFAYLAYYRDALAHRIPLYIAPHNVDPKNWQQYLILDQKLREVAEDDAAFAQFRAEQDAISFFRPVATQDGEDGLRNVAFHAQMLVDLNTVEELSLAMIAEIKAKRGY
jgi:hypothetical protein